MRVSPRSLRKLGIFLTLAGAGVWVLSLWQDRIRADSEAQRFFGDLGREEEESPRDASVLIALSHANRAVRTAFLFEALRSDEAADKLRLHEQGLSVALSQVDYSEALALYRAALRPALEGSPGPEVLRGCFALLSRWSLISQITPQDAAGITSRLTARMAAESEAGTLAQFASAIVELSPRIDKKSAASLAENLLARAMTDRDLSVVYAASRSLVAIAPLLSPDTRREHASALAARLATERNRALLQALAPALSALSVALDPAVSGDIAESLANRIAGEWDPGSLGALVPAFRSVAEQVDPARAQHIAMNLLQHVKLEPDPSLLLPMTQALGAFGRKLPLPTYEEAGAALLKRIQTEPDPGTLSALAHTLGVLKDKASAKQFEEASSRIVSRLATEHNLETLSVLAVAIDLVADDLEPPAAQRLSSVLVARIIEEHDAGSLLYLAVGLESIADEARGPGAAALVARLAARMREERSSNVLRSLAFAAGAFKNVEGDFEVVAKLLISRMAEENKPEDLRALTSALYSLRHKAGAPSFEKAASILAVRIQTESDPSAIRTLVASLHAMKEKSGPEPFEQAASAMVANAQNLASLEPALQRIAAKLRTPKAQELASLLVGRFGREKDPQTLRFLGRALADLPVRSNNLDTGPMLAIPQAPCQISDSASQLFNPLCNENAWNDLAASVVRAKPRAPKDDIEPDFTELAPDDDDGAASLPEDDRSLDFHKLSDALGGLRPSEQRFMRLGRIRWSSIALLISAGLTLLYYGRGRVRLA